MAPLPTQIRYDLSASRLKCGDWWFVWLVHRLTHFHQFPLSRPSDRSIVHEPERARDPIPKFAQLLPEDVSEDYVGWLNDPEINEFLEVRHHAHTLASVREYVRECLEKKRHHYGVFHGERHVGNVTFTPVNSH